MLPCFFCVFVVFLIGCIVRACVIVVLRVVYSLGVLRSMSIAGFGVMLVVSSIGDLLPLDFLGIRLMAACTRPDMVGHLLTSIRSARHRGRKI